MAEKEFYGSRQKSELEGNVMKAAVYRSYGTSEVLKIEEIEKPTPNDDEVLVKVRASSVNPAQWYTMIGFFLACLGNGLIKPKDTRLGTDFAGVVEGVGKDVTQVKPGDEVFGACRGAFAEFVCARDIVIPKPANITFEQAAGSCYSGDHSPARTP